VALDGLELERHGVQVAPQFNKFRDVRSRSHEIFRHDFDGAHLAVLGVLLDVRDEFLLLLLEVRALSI